jgi:negative regulator of flagellin synthesis FlgM
MDINKIHGVEKVVAPAKTKTVDRTEGVASSDQVTLSAESREKADIRHAMEIVRSAPDVRADKVAEFKALVESGRFGNSEVIERVAKKMLEDLG